MSMILQRLAAIWICLSVLLPLSACEKKAVTDYVAFTGASLEEAITWTVNGKEYAGHLSLASKETNATREAELVYTSPAALAGLHISIGEAGAYASLNGVCHTLGDAEREAFFCFLRFFSQEAAAHAICTHENGKTRLTFSDEEGEYTVYMANGKPSQLTFLSPTCTISLLLDGDA